MPPTEKETMSGSGAATSTPAHTLRIPSQTLFRGQHRLIIEHAGEVYILRLTRNNRLILTKS